MQERSGCVFAALTRLILHRTLVITPEASNQAGQPGGTEDRGCPMATLWSIRSSQSSDYQDEAPSGFGGRGVVP